MLDATHALALKGFLSFIIQATFAYGRHNIYSFKFMKIFKIRFCDLVPQLHAVHFT